MKKIAIAITLLILLQSATAAITNLNIPEEIRLGENLTIRGDHGTANVLCKFLILDTNANAVERLTDEYTFADGSFFSQRQLIEPPYYRGDDFNVHVTCGTDTAFSVFTVNQPVSLAQPIQKGWEYIFDQSNQEAIQMVVGVIGFLILVIAGILVIIKWSKGKNAG